MQCPAAWRRAVHSPSQVLDRNNPKPVQWLLNEILRKVPCQKEHFFFLGCSHCPSKCEQQLEALQSSNECCLLWVPLRALQPSPEIETSPPQLRFLRQFQTTGLCELPRSDCDCHVKSLLPKRRCSEVFSCPWALLRPNLSSPVS